MRLSEVNPQPCFPPIPGDQALRRPARRDVDLPRPRQRHHHGHGAAPPRGVARTRLVTVRRRPLQFRNRSGGGRAFRPVPRSGREGHTPRTMASRATSPTSAAVTAMIRGTAVWAAVCRAGFPHGPWPPGRPGGEPRGGPEAEDGEVFRQRIRVAVDRGPRPRPARLAPPGSCPTRLADDPTEAVPGDAADAAPAIRWTPRRRASGWTRCAPAQSPPRSPSSRPPARRSSSRTRAGPAGWRGRSVFRRP
ncbi:hypothetical protein SAMN06272771_1859 [Streptomyces sp. Ag82_O1-12]|nr:hypothetical protein SAMN06272771_1859 [Streptomyces sp. Ag82_O1-12]SOD44553.1 hypothetical protein SAMN06272727_1851 [Streptomyces sp. Ag82_G6-1]